MTIAPKVIQFPSRQTYEGEDETPLTQLRAAAPVVETVKAKPTVDLSGKPKLWFVSGPGRSGKTTLLRWAIETSANHGGAPLIAACDPTNRSLKLYAENVLEPTSNEPAAVARWLDALARHVIARQTSALVDLGGGDTAFGRLLASVPDLGAILAESGVAPVAVYTVGPRVDDLAVMDAIESAGFTPAATVLVCNEGLADPTMERDEAFGRVLRHSAFKAITRRGAAVCWMPRLDPAVAQEIEAKRLSFVQARDAQSPEGRQVPPLGPLDRSRVRLWLSQMDAALAPILTWLP